MELREHAALEHRVLGHALDDEVGLGGAFGGGCHRRHPRERALQAGGIEEAGRDDLLPVGAGPVLQRGEDGRVRVRERDLAPEQGALEPDLHAHGAAAHDQHAADVPDLHHVAPLTAGRPASYPTARRAPPDDRSRG